MKYWFVSFCGCVLSLVGSGLLARTRASGFITRWGGRIFWWPRVRYLLAGIVFIYGAIASSQIFTWRHEHLDETAYWLQARTYAAGLISLPLEPGYQRFFWRDYNPNFFISPFEAVVGDRKVVIYSPTYPLILAAGIVAGVPWLPNALFAALTVLLGARIAGNVFGRDAGTAAAWFFAASPAVVLHGANYLSESAFLCGYLFFIWIFLWAQRKDDARAFLLLGVVWGLLFTIREYVTFLGTLPFLFLLARDVFKGHRVILFFVPGAVFGVAPVLFYNFLITGKPWLFPRFLGPIQYFGPGNFGRSVSKLFLFTTSRFVAFNNDALGWPFSSIMPIALALWWRPRVTFVKLGLAVAAVVFLGHIPVDNVGVDYVTRYLLPIVPFVAFFAADAAAKIRAAEVTRKPFEGAFFHGGLLLLVGVAVLNVSLLTLKQVGPSMEARVRAWQWVTPELKRALNYLNVHNAVVFIGPWPHGFSAMPNDPTLRDDIIYARDQGERNYLLMRAFPGRRFLRCDYLVFEKEGIIYEIEAARGSGGRRGSENVRGPWSRRGRAARPNSQGRVDEMQGLPRGDFHRGVGAEP